MSEPRFINVSSMLITDQLAQSPVYIKVATVHAVRVDATQLNAGAYAAYGVHPDGQGGFVIDTYVMTEDADGRRIPKRKGDSQPIHPGDWIVTNPPKQPGDYPNHYGKTDQSFRDRYEQTERSAQMGIYRARGLIRCIQNPTDTDIRISAYWGDYQDGDTDCFICAPVDRQNLDDLGVGKRYLLSRNDFETTYQPVEEILGPDWREKI